MAGVTMPLGIWSDPEWTGLSSDEWRLAAALWSYAADKLTDGHIRARDVEQIALLNRIPEHPTLIDGLVRAEVLKAESKDCWMLPGFLDLNQTEAQVEAFRRAGRERLQAWRAKQKAKQPKTPGKGSQKS